MKRRDFLQTTAATGLFVFVPVPVLAFQEPEKLPARQSGFPKDFNAYLRIGADGRVGCCVGKVELGQGAMTALAMLLAEELEVDLDAVDMLMGDTDLCPWDIGTFGSLSMWQFGPVLRGAAAEARAVLLEMAAEHLHAPVASLRARHGVVTRDGDAAQSVSYAALVQGKRIERHLPGVVPKPMEPRDLNGPAVVRKDALAKVTGKAQYTADFNLPGTLHACILRPPAHGARLKTVDVEAAAALPGVRVVRMDDFVAVLHRHPDAARAALGKVKATWQRTAPALDDRTIFAHLVKAAPPAKAVGAKGDLKTGEAEAATRVDRTYLNSYVAHAPMETHSALAWFHQGRLTVWASAQAPFMMKAQVAQAVGLAPKDVRIITPYVGGGFGGKSNGLQAVEAARLARATGLPVQVVWNRKEEFFLDPFRPAAVVTIRSGLTKAGRIAFWDYHVYCAGEREADFCYDIPHQRTLASGGWNGGNPAGLHPFPIGAWRAPAANTNVFAREVHMDVLAAQAGVDPLDFRLRHLTEPRLRRALKAVAEQFGWQPKAGPSGRGVGVACGTYRDTVVAVMAEVAVDRATGQVQVKRIAMAQDLGVIVNPDGVRQQMEGCITMGLSAALLEEVRFKDGEVLDENFDTYPLPRFSAIPAIQTILIDNPGLPAQGGGEPPIVCVAPVLANAIFDAVGARVLQLPLTPARILAALKG